MGKKNIEDFKNGALLDNRSCTDCPIIIVWLLFTIGWGVIGYFAINNGNPKHILLPENFAGNLCGELNTPLADYKYAFIPLPNRIEYSVCVKECPTVESFVCNNLPVSTTDASFNHKFNMNSTEVSEGKAAIASCVTTCDAATQAKKDKLVKVFEKASENHCYPVFYSSSPLLNRCLPLSAQNTELLANASSNTEALKNLSDTLGVGTFLSRGLGEMEDAWKLVLTCFGAAVIFSIIWLILIRFLLAPIIYLAILSLFFLLCAIGYFARAQSINLETVVLPGQNDTEGQQRTLEAVQHISWILAGIYFLVMIWMLKRIRIAIEVIKVGSKALQDNLGLVFMPIMSFIIATSFIVLAILLSLYIQTMGEVSVSDFVMSSRQTLTSSIINQTGYDISTLPIPGNITVNTTVFEKSSLSSLFHAYNFFGLLWFANIAIGLSFFIQCFVVVIWYFSVPTMDMVKSDSTDEHPEDHQHPEHTKKYTSIGTLGSVVIKSLTTHFGTVLLGSLLIAIIQFIRAIFLYIQENYLDKWKNEPFAKVVIYCINCCLACIERAIKIISKNAYIMCCITNKSFCPSAIKVIKLIVSNVARFSTISFISSIAFLVLKVSIVCSNICLAYALMLYVPQLTNNKALESGLFPLLAIGVFTFLISTIFISAYESATDAVFLCVLYDEDNLDGAFLPKKLSKLLNVFENIEKARLDYQNRVEGISMDDKTDE